MNKSCRQCQAGFQVREEDRKFYETISPTFDGQKIAIPEPTLCPQCRQQRRLAWRNERKLYWRNCDATGKRILSVFAADFPGKVYEKDYWWSDAWSPFDYGRDFDFSRSFFEQFQELMLAVPQMSISIVQNQNSEYVNQAGWNKNCHLIFEGNNNQDCQYSNYITYSTSCLDDVMIRNCQLCYECIDCTDCYGLQFSQNCQNCSSSAFLKNCIGCKNCFGCVNMRNKEFCFFNEQLSKEAYEQKMQEIDLSDYQQLQHWKLKFLPFAQQFPHKFLTGHQNEDSTGDYLINTQRCHQCFDIIDAQDCAYVGYGNKLRSVHDMNVFGQGVEFCYEVHEVGDRSRGLLFCEQSWEDIYDLIYCKLCMNGSHHLFGCVGMKHQSYCILNKQYAEEEYNQLVPRIIEHMKNTPYPSTLRHAQGSGSASAEWGEFFPGAISPFAYNQSLAQEYFPLEKEEVLSRGWKWREEVDEMPEADRVIPADKLPDKLADTPDDILNWAIQCAETGRPYKINPMELKFYRMNKLPIPRLHHDQRHAERMKMRNPRQMWQRMCEKCQAIIQTSYSPERPEAIYCQQCYQSEVT